VHRGHYHIVTTRLDANDDVIDWLLEGDVAIRWQVLRDLVGSPERAVSRERQKVASDGWGARLLAQQDSEGTWGGGMYNPKWTSTTYTLLLLRDFGLAPTNEAARQGCALLLDTGLRDDCGVNFKSERSETCITGMVLSILSYFRYRDPRLDAIVGYVLDQQMPDGGWNCRRSRGATHASVHTTISVLEGLWLYSLHRRHRSNDVRDALARGREFLLEHRLFRSHRTGRVIKSEFTRFVFPPRWHYDILRALDHFQAVDAPRDPRLAEAVGIVEQKRQSDGRWLLDNSYNGVTFFNIEQRGKPSRWNTLRALRVVRWWNQSSPRPRVSF
jgi:hypothetical protein